jgi:alginate O-acetyltransferase complex protein AlgI
LVHSRQFIQQTGLNNRMSILSVKFLYFVLITLVIYYLVPVLSNALENGSRLAQNTIFFRPISRILHITGELTGKLQNLILLLASYKYYATWFYYFPYVLFIQTLLSFGMGYWLGKSTRGKRSVFWLGILLNITPLLWLLISGKLFQNTSNVALLLILPVIGMSYYTLNSVSYLIDINLRLSKPSTNFIDFALYLAWFPKLISGPLERARKFLPQLASKRMVNNESIVNSLTLILIGLFRTAILGGMLTLYLSAIPLRDPAAYGSLVLIWALITYMFYLYNQFAGYTDIARGVSGLFGIQLSRNFNAPFFSKDISDFWQRWHISLSQWLRDYIYMPVSRAFLRRNPSRTNIPNLIVPPLVTMLISGLWHGADLNHLAWGALMGLFILIDNVCMLYRPAMAAASIPFWRRFSSWTWLVLLMAAATVPFVLDLKQTLVFFVRVVNGWDGQMFDLRPLAIIILSLLMDWYQYRKNDELVFQKWPVWSQALLIAIIPFAVIVINQLQSAPPVFVYP